MSWCSAPVAAGLMAAITAGKRGLRVLVLDHADRIGKKILISGGGRCNFTNLHCTADRFLSANPHFARSALARYTPRDFIALVEQHRIPFHEKTLGQLFCDRSASDIVSMLEAGGPRCRSSSSPQSAHYRDPPRRRISRPHFHGELPPPRSDRRHRRFSPFQRWALPTSHTASPHNSV